MEEIDFRQRQKELTSFTNHLKRYLEYKSTIPANIFIFLSSGALTSSKKSLKALGLVTLIPSLIISIKAWRNTKGIYKSLTKEIKETEEYQLLKQKYNELTTKIAIYLKSLNLENSLEINTYLANMIENGIFSYNSEMTHHTPKYIFEVLADLTGAVVCSGNSVCRHYSSFITDILNKMGYTACNINVSLLTEEELIKLSSLKSLKFHHEVVGIIDKNKKYYFDALYGLFLENYGTVRNYNILKALGSEIYNIESFSSVLNDQYIEQLYTFKNTEPRPIEEEEIEYICNTIVPKFKEDFPNIIAFHQEIEPLLEEINELLKKISPSSDTKIPEWKLKKSLQISKN